MQSEPIFPVPRSARACAYWGNSTYSFSHTHLYSCYYRLSRFQKLHPPTVTPKCSKIPAKSYYRQNPSLPSFSAVVLRRPLVKGRVRKILFLMQEDVSERRHSTAATSEQLTHPAFLFFVSFIFLAGRYPEIPILPHPTPNNFRTCPAPPPVPLPLPAGRNAYPILPLLAFT